MLIEKTSVDKTNCPQLEKDYPEHYVDVYEILPSHKRVLYSLAGALPPILAMAFLSSLAIDKLIGSRNNVFGVNIEIFVWVFFIVVCVVAVAWASQPRKGEGITYIASGLRLPIIVVAVSGLQTLLKPFF